MQRGEQIQTIFVFVEEVNWDPSTQQVATEDQGRPLALHRVGRCRPKHVLSLFIEDSETKVQERTEPPNVQIDFDGDGAVVWYRSIERNPVRVGDAQGAKAKEFCFQPTVLGCDVD